MTMGVNKEAGEVAAAETGVGAAVGGGPSSMGSISMGSLFFSCCLRASMMVVLLLLCYDSVVDDDLVLVQSCYDIVCELFRTR